MFFQDQFGGFKLKGRDEERLEIAEQFGCGSLEAATLVVQQFQWKFVGRPRALTSYRSARVVNVLSSSKLKHIWLLKSMADVHGIDEVFDCCT